MSETKKIPANKTFVSTPTDDTIQDIAEEISKDPGWPAFPSKDILDFGEEDLNSSKYLSLLIYALKGEISNHKNNTLKLTLDVFFRNERQIYSLMKQKKSLKDTTVKHHLDYKEEMIENLMIELGMKRIKK